MNTRPPAAGKGRPKGSKNKYSAEIKKALRNALDSAHPEGMEGYFVQQAQENPQSFLSLVGKLLPSEIDHGGEVGVREVTRRIIEGPVHDAAPLPRRRVVQG